MGKHHLLVHHDYRIMATSWGLIMTESSLELPTTLPPAFSLVMLLSLAETFITLL